MPNREFPFNQPIHPEDNQSINRVFDRNYGNKLKSGDTTTLKYTVKDGDGEPLDKDRLIDMTTKVILKYDGIIAYETSFDAIIENETDNYAGDLIARFKVEEVLPPDEKKPYVIEFHFEELDQSDEVIDRFIFPSGNTLELFITPSALNSDSEAIGRANDERLDNAVKRAIESDVVLLDIKEQEQQRIDNESERQTNYNELVDTGIMQENINQKLSESEQTYAPRLTSLEKNYGEIILARGSYDTLGERFEDVDRRLTAQAVVMGVEWDKQSDPTLKRIGASEDLVANIGIGDEVVRNDFDNMPIYREIQKEVDMYGNVFVRIPRFYIRKTETDSLKRIEISTEKLKGFYLPAVFYDFENQKEVPYAHIGAYSAGISLDGTKLESKVGVGPLVNKNIVEFRNLAQANGVGYQQLDIHAVDVIQTLFYVEFATLNSQSMHPGYTGGTEAKLTGGTDGVAASSGAAGADNTNQFMYRGIEDLWGHLNQWVDGVNIIDNQAWVCEDENSYSSNVFAAPYQKLSYANVGSVTNGFVKEMGFDPSRPYAQFPVTLGAGTTTYYSDNYYQNPGQRVALFGGGWSNGLDAGVSYWALNYDPVLSSGTIGGRLLRKPL